MRTFSDRGGFAISGLTCSRLAGALSLPSASGIRLCSAHTGAWLGVSPSAYNNMVTSGSLRGGYHPGYRIVVAMLRILYMRYLESSMCVYEEGLRNWVGIS